MSGQKSMGCSVKGLGNGFQRELTELKACSVPGSMLFFLYLV